MGNVNINLYITNIYVHVNISKYLNKNKVICKKYNMLLNAIYSESNMQKVMKANLNEQNIDYHKK